MSLNSVKTLGLIPSQLQKAKAQHSMLMANLNRQGYREIKLGSHPSNQSDLTLPIMPLPIQQFNTKEPLASARTTDPDSWSRAPLSSSYEASLWSAACRN